MELDLKKVCLDTYEPGGEFTFTHYPEDPDYLPNLRAKIYSALTSFEK